MSELTNVSDYIDEEVSPSRGKLRYFKTIHQRLTTCTSIVKSTEKAKTPHRPIVILDN